MTDDGEIDTGGEGSGPFCPHWGSPDWCTERCTCGHTCDLHWIDGRECNYRDCPCEAFTDTEPDRATDGISRDIRRTAQPRKEPEMTKDTDGGEALQRVRIPLGSPSQPTNETQGNPDRTELRSDATAEDRPATRRPQVDDLVEAGYAPDSGADPMKWQPERVIRRFGDHRQVLQGFETAGGNQYYDNEEGVCWRWPVAEAAPAPVAAVLRHPSELLLDPEPEPRRCTADVTDLDETVNLCGAVLGPISCDLCGGGKCYQHCAGVDHFGGQTVLEGHSAHDLVRWKIVEIAKGRFRGQVTTHAADGPKIIGQAYGGTGDEVLSSLRGLIDQGERLASVRPPSPAPDRRVSLPFGVLDFVAKAPDKAAGKRAELLREVMEWLRSCEHDWERLAYDLPETADRAKDLHDRQVLELFSRLAGAL